MLAYHITGGGGDTPWLRHVHVHDLQPFSGDKVGFFTVCLLIILPGGGGDTPWLRHVHVHDLQPVLWDKVGFFTVCLLIILPGGGDTPWLRHVHDLQPFSGDKVGFFTVCFLIILPGGGGNTPWLRHVHVQDLQPFSGDKVGFFTVCFLIILPGWGGHSMALSCPCTRPAAVLWGIRLVSLLFASLSYYRGGGGDTPWLRHVHVHDLQPFSGDKVCLFTVCFYCIKLRAVQGFMPFHLNSTAESPPSSTGKNKTE